MSKGLKTIFFSHGREGSVYTADGRSVSLERIYEFFNNRNSPDLIGKPKFFIVQACRGELADTGVEGDKYLIIIYILIIYFF